MVVIPDPDRSGYCHWPAGWNLSLLLPVGVQTGGRPEGKRKPWKQEFEVEERHGHFSVHHLHYFDHRHRDYPPPDEVYP